MTDVFKIGRFPDPLLDRQINELVRAVNTISAATSAPLIDAVFSNPVSVISGNPVPTGNLNIVFTDPASVING